MPLYHICIEFPPDFRPFLEELIRTQQFSEFVDSHIFEVGRDPGKRRVLERGSEIGRIMTFLMNTYRCLIISNTIYYL